MQMIHTKNKEKNNKKVHFISIRMFVKYVLKYFENELTSSNKTWQNMKTR